MKHLILLWILLLSFCSFSQPKISFTFDDGSLDDKVNYTFDQWNTMLLNKLRDAKVKTIFFVTGNGKTNDKGKHLLKSWNDDGHKIANHTFTHPNFNITSIEDFKNELLINDQLINSYTNYSKFFRFPYLKEGNTKEKIVEFRNFLKDQNYRNGYVTIDASDWYIDHKLLKRLRENPNADISKYKSFYLNHIWERAQFYEKLSFELNGRHINHTLLLHHNLAAALFIDDLIKMFTTKGWEIISASKAYEDTIYKKIPSYAGESLIYAQAKDIGKYENILRYPAEDSRYEKEKMNLLGL